MNMLVIAGVLVPVIALVIFIIKRNMKDKNELEDYIKHDYPGSTEKATDVELEEKTH